MNSVEAENIEGIEKVIPEHKVISKKDLLGLPGAKQVLIAFFCYCSIEATTGLWGSSYAVMTHGIQADTAARWASLFFFGITFGRFLSGFVTLKLNNRQMVRLGEVFITVGIILIMLPAGQVTSLLGFILTGVGCAPIYPSLLHETPENFGAEYSQSIMGVQMACAYVGSTFIPPIFGAVASKLGYSIMPYFTGFLLILMFVMTEMLNKRVDAKKNMK